MRNVDFSPLFKTTIGFDHLASLMDEMAGFTHEAPKYPPYNIELMDEQHYRLTMAVAGFAEDDLEMEVKENVLTVKGTRPDEEAETTFLHRGIAARNFVRQFKLADHVIVQGAELVNGLLHVELVREIPEAKKPRKIAISTDSSTKAITDKQNVESLDAGAVKEKEAAPKVQAAE